MLNKEKRGGNIIKWNTKIVWIGDKCYCVYCDKEKDTDYEYDGYIEYRYFCCNCEGAKLDIEKQKIEKKLAELEKDAQKKLNELRFRHELAELKKKYNIC